MIDQNNEKQWGNKYKKTWKTNDKKFSHLVQFLSNADRKNRSAILATAVNNRPSFKLAEIRYIPNFLTKWLIKIYDYPTGENCGDFTYTYVREYQVQVLNVYEAAYSGLYDAMIDETKVRLKTTIAILRKI